jgi:hypothetical protein
VLSFFIFFIFSTKHKHAYIRTYVYYSNDFDLRKIRVAQDLPERNDCVSRGLSVYYEGESNENRKTGIKIRNIAPLSSKLADMLPML